MLSDEALFEKQVELAELQNRIQNKIKELEGQLKLARAEVSEYREKLQAAEKIAEDVERELDTNARLVDEHAAKIEELDDSSGSFDQFVDELYCDWIKARQADDASPDETASRLL